VAICILAAEFLDPATELALAAPAAAVRKSRGGKTVC
jgi:hypothetical protein